MAINQFQNVNVGDVAQAYSVPLEGVIDTIQRQQQLNLQQQQLRHQEQMQRQQMEVQNQDAIDAALSSVHATGTAYDEYLMQQQKNLMARTQEALRRNPMEARSIARRGAADLSYRAAQAKGLSDRIADTVTALDKQNPYYNTSLLSGELMNAALKDEKGNFREAPDVSVLNRLGEFAGNPRYMDQGRLDKAARESVVNTYKPDESMYQGADAAGRLYTQKISAPIFSEYDQNSRSFRTKSIPVEFPNIGKVNVLPEEVNRQLINDPFFQKVAPIIKQQMLNANPALSNIPESILDRAAAYSYADRYGNAVKGSITEPNYKQYELSRQARQDAFQNSMAQQRLANSNRQLDLAEQRLKSKEELTADANVFKDAITGTNRNGTTRAQQQEVFAKYAAPYPTVEATNAFLSKYSKGKELAEAYTTTKDGKRNFQQGDLARDLTPINISGAYTNAKVVNPFNGQHGSAQLWIDPHNGFKKVVVFQPTKTKKDEVTGFVITVPDYENMKVYEGDQGVRFIEQLKDSESKKGLNATDFIDNEE